MRCRQSRACSTRHTNSYSPVILSWRPHLPPSYTRGATAFIQPCGRRGPSLHVPPPPHARTPFCCQHLTSPPPPSSSCLGSPAPASTWTVLIGWCETVTRPLGPRMWPNPARQGRASTYELSGPGPSTPPSVWRASCRRRQPLLAGSQKCTHLRGWIWRFQGLGVSGGIRSLILPTFMARPETVSEE